MSREHVEIVLRGYEHHNRTGDPDYELLDPEIVYDVSRRDADETHGDDHLISRVDEVPRALACVKSRLTGHAGL